MNAQDSLGREPIVKSDRDRLAACREQASRLLPKLQFLETWAQRRASKHPDWGKAFIMEFAGMPKAGKTTTIENIRHYFSHGPKILHKTRTGWGKAQGFKVLTPAEGVSLRTPTFLKSNLADYNTWSGAYAIQELIQAESEKYFDLVILDRGPWDAGCWLQGVKQFKRDHFEKTSETEIDAVVHFFQLAHWTTQAHIHVVLTVDPSIAKQRETEDRLIDHAGPASDIHLMTKMKEIYSTRFAELRRLKDDACPETAGLSALLIETSTLNPHEIAVKVIENVFNFLEKSTQEPRKADQIPLLIDIYIPQDSKPITREELREYILPDSGRWVRKAQKKKFNEALGDLHALALRVPNQTFLRKKLEERKLTLGPDEEALGGLSVPADVVIGEVTALIRNLIEPSKEP